MLTVGVPAYGLINAKITSEIINCSEIIKELEIKIIHIDFPIGVLITAKCMQ